MSQKKIRRQFTTTYKGHKGVPNNQPSMTVPDMNLTLKELLHNHTRGIQSNVHNYEPQYFEDEEIPQINDLTDLLELKRKNDAKLKQVQKQAEDDIKSAAAKKAAQKAANIEVQKTIDTPPNQVLPAEETQQK